MSKLALRIFNIVLYSLALASVVTFHVLWLNGKMSLGTQLTLSAAALVMTGLTIGAEGLIDSYEQRTQRGFRVILKDERRPE